MSQITSNFIKEVIKVYDTDHGREHSYRPSLKDFFTVLSGLTVVNEPKRSEYGAPDFVFLDKKIVTAYAEAKDLNVLLAETVKGEQMGRYYGYSNIILTNCLEFRFYRNGQEYVPAITIARLNGNAIELDESKFELLEDTIQAFIKGSKEPIRSGKHLAKVMAGKARRIRDNIKIFLADDDNTKNENLFSIYEVIKKLLLADLDKEKFADMYAQTVVYGLFAARYYDPTPETFTRQEARDLLPASNPFLRHFFDHIAGPSFDPRIEVIVDELCEEFRHADVQAIVHDYYKVEKDDSRDPIIHFYEDFLQEYDSLERKKMGVFYTPLPVVRFIVRAVDDILKRDFGLAKGLADTEKIEVKQEVQGKQYKKQIHKVQVLDPATGTGTFLNEVILHIRKSFAGQEGRWNNYVNEDLLPRLHGFELMMASYTIAHLKLSSMIIETGAKLEGKARLGVYLTNSLEKGEAEERTLFSGIGLGKAISDESHEASKIKHDLPIMVVLGNPPYNVSSQNKNEYISELIKDYKKDLNEKNIQPLSDDYIKFIRLAEDLIEQNGEGVIGMITNNSFLDGNIHAQMRKHLLETFDKIYILDLHGNSKRKEVTPDGGKDENVFAIQQGVSIFLFVKTGIKKKGLANVYHSELFGKQKVKFSSLDNNDIKNTNWIELNYKEPYYFFVPKDFSLDGEYNTGFCVNDIFKESSVGIVTSRDEFLINDDKKILEKKLNDISRVDLTDKEFEDKYNLNTKYFNSTEARNKSKNKQVSKIVDLYYRPMDKKYLIYDVNFIERSRNKVMRNMILERNLALVCSKQNTKTFIDNFQVVDSCIELKFNSHDRNSSIFPLYLYNNDGTKTPNLKKEIVAEIEKTVGQTTPEDILDYIYAVLHSPSYCEKYKEFLKIDFPRVPYPTDKETFFKLVNLGRELRSLHLLESAKVNDFITTFSEAGSDTVEKKYLKYRDGKVYINETQYFGNVPEIAWNFYIGGYQPAQKWLKDRQERRLSNTDIEHYQKMIVSLVETARIMGEIDEIK